MRPCALALLCMVAAAATVAGQMPLPLPPPWAGGPPDPAHMQPGARFATAPGWMTPVPETAVLQDLDEQQFIAHWVYTYYVMDGGIDVDLIGENSFEGMWQRNDIFDALGVSSLVTARTALYLQILDNPTGTYWYPYVAVNDNGTSDPVFFSQGYLGSFPPELED